jgi:hypothetical protein
MTGRRGSYRRTSSTVSVSYVKVQPASTKPKAEFHLVRRFLAKNLLLF